MDLRVAIPEEDVTPPVMEAGLEATTRLDEQQIRRGDVPLFDDADPGGSVVWQPEPPGAERFDHARRVLARGWGDCDDLAPWQAASYRVTGVDKKAKAIVVKSGPNRWHAVVRLSDGSIVDPSVTAGMPYSVVGGDGVPPDDLCACPAVVPRIHKPGYCALSLQQNPVNGGWLARADVPIGTSRYALSSLRGSNVPSQAIVGAINSVVGWSDAAGVLKRSQLGKLLAVAGLCSGHSEADISQLCGKEATRIAWGMAKQVEGLNILGGYDDDDGDDDDYDDDDNDDDFGDGTYDDGAPLQRILPPATVDEPIVPPEQAPHPPIPRGPVSAPLATVARNVVNHPQATHDEQQLASLVHDQALGIRPPQGSLKSAVYHYFGSVHGPVTPGSADDHARLLLADQVAKRIARRIESPLMPPEQALVGFDFGQMLSDIGNGIGQAGKAVANVVKQVGPTVASVAAVLPPPYGPAISGAVTGAVALANAVSPSSSSAPSSSAATRSSSPPVPGGAAVNPFGSRMPRQLIITPGQGANISVVF